MTHCSRSKTSRRPLPAPSQGSHSHCPGVGLVRSLPVFWGRLGRNLIWKIGLVSWDPSPMRSLEVHRGRRGAIREERVKSGETRTALDGSPVSNERLGRLRVYGAERLAEPDPELLVTYRQVLVEV